MRISVALTTFEPHLGFLEQQVQSIGEQDRRPDELVWSDDGSASVSPTEIAAVVRSAGIDVTDLSGTTNIGLRQNWERVLRGSAGDVIILSDQDDIWAPNKVGAIETAFDKESVALWFSDADMIDHNNEPIAPSVFDVVGLDPAAVTSINDLAGIIKLQYGATVTGATMAISACVLDAALPLPLDLDGDGYLYLHDGWLAIFAAVMGEVVVDPRPLTHYRQHAAQFTGMAFQQMLGGKDAARQLSETADEHLQLDCRRAMLLGERVRSAGLDRSSAGSYLTDREAYLKRRLSMSPAQIGRALATGQYKRHGRGVATAAKDIVRLARRNTTAKA